MTASRPDAWWRSGYARLAVLTAVAATVAYLIAAVTPFADPIPAAITAAVATRVTFHHAAKETVFQILGALLGAVVALVIVFLTGSGPLVILVLILLAYALARLLPIGTREEAPFIAAGISVTMILVVGTHFTTELAVERFNGVAIGALCSLVASYFTKSDRDTRVLREDLTALQQDLAMLLSEIAVGLRTSPSTQHTSDWTVRAVALRDRSMGLDAIFEDLRTHRRWDPRIDPDELAELDRSLKANRVMSIRILTITSDLATAVQPSTKAALPQEALNPLADLFAVAADNMAAEDPTASVGRTQMHEAVRQADQTAQIALIGGIVSNLERIHEASAAAVDISEDNAT